MRNLSACHAFAAGLALLIAGPAAIQDARAETAPVAAQFADARKAFLADTPDADVFMSEFRARLFAGMEGDWAQLTMLKAGTVDEKGIAAACKSLAFHLSPKDAYSFKVTVDRDGGRELETTFVSMGGNTFAFTADPGKLMHFLGLDADEAVAPIRATALSANSGIAQLFRPSADIIVVQSNASAPRIYGRCP